MALGTDKTFTASVVALSFTIQNFVEERKNDAVLCMPPFYSHNGGYKMCLVVYCNGYREAKGNYLTVLVRAWTKGQV